MINTATVKLNLDPAARALALLDDWIDAYLSSTDRSTRRAAAQQIRKLACAYPGLADYIPDVVWRGVYCVRASGTINP